MKQQFKGWDEVERRLLAVADDAHSQRLNAGQRASLRGVARRIGSNGVIIADEVGMGKTRIATSVARAVVEAGGRVAILVPSGLGFQWRSELQEAGAPAPALLRSVAQYLKAWDTEDASASQPWFEQSVVLISHMFANWRLGADSDPWRWNLLPQLYALRRERRPRNYHDNEKLTSELARLAAQSIHEGIDASADETVRERVEEIAEDTPWPGALEAKEYQRDKSLRPLLETAVGLGLGTFDLVIVDEAHKSRSEKSTLSVLQERIILPSKRVRRFAMTATPVELNVNQWSDVLRRIDVDPADFSEVFNDYAKAVVHVRQTPLNAKTRDDFKHAAQRFQAALDPYLLRRDKREDDYVRLFAGLADQSSHAYRHEDKIAVETSKLSVPWKRAVCAAEALSAMKAAPGDTGAKRLRLTLGNGHGIAAMLRRIEQDDNDDHLAAPIVSALVVEEEASHSRSDASSVDATLSGTKDKRAKRAQWWSDVLVNAFKADNDSLFDHPAILAAVDAIEKIANDRKISDADDRNGLGSLQRGEKVLVFGRFTAPLQALVELLNARAMLRSLGAGKSWSQAKLSVKDHAAIRAAYRQLKANAELNVEFLNGGVDTEALNKLLEEQYAKLEQTRERFRNDLLTNLETGFAGFDQNSRAVRLFEAFKKSATGSRNGDSAGSIAIVARAISELIGNQADNSDSRSLAREFVDLVDASSDRDDHSETEDSLGEEKAAEMWAMIEARIREEYNRPEGGFARLMYGDTKHETRRLLQLAFNRANSFPQVLVAQSLVGREGLNLHKSCKTVVLLHPEWNPGVVEQQIGRVDRVGSLWQQRMEEVRLREGIPLEELPRIDILPVVFQGTYDEKNWEVLRDRWDDLRAQLHGVVISPLMAGRSSIPADVVEEINSAAPNFSPTK